MQKTNNNRKFPGTRGPRPDLDATKKAEAKVRQEAYDKLSINEKLAKLDLLFGKDKGAQKQRALYRIQQEKAETVAKAEAAVVENETSETPKKDKARGKRQAQA